MKPAAIKPMEILEHLERGEISVDKAISLLKKYQKKYQKKDERGLPVRKAHWLKIRIREEKHNFRLYLPISLFSLGFSIGKLAIGSRFVPDDQDLTPVKQVLNNIDRRDMKKLVKAVKESGKIDMVNIVDGDTLVDISIV